MFKVFKAYKNKCVFFLKILSAKLICLSLTEITGNIPSLWQFPENPNKWNEQTFSYIIKI